jgi:sugar phosphate isomerase/epimerase
MFKSAVTICLFPEGKSGPFLFHGELSAEVQRAAEIGFDAVEIFAPAAEAINVADLRMLLDDHNLKLAAVGTGAGFVLHRLTLIEPDPARRARAMDFARRMIDLGGAFGAPAIVGSMQGRHADGDRDAALDRFAGSLARLSDHAKLFGVPLLYEPLNRYETNIFNRQGDAAAFIRTHQIQSVKILADLFHMNIEESNLSGALLEVGNLLGHVHFVDSNRRAAGLGHMDYRPIITALREINYRGYLSAEALPLPDSQTAALSTMETFRRVTA